MPPNSASAWFARPRLVLPGLALVAALVGLVRADDPPPRRPEGWPDPAQFRRERPREKARPQQGADREQEKQEKEKDGPLDPFFDLIDPARFQRIIDRVFAGETDSRRPERERPEVPEIGEPVFFDLTRPLGARRYSNEFNYLLNPSTANAPTLQVLEYEYTFADWNSAELDLAYFNGNLEILTPFYQRTLGVGRAGRSVRGIQVSPDIYLRSGFVGGSAVYQYGWKPSKESRFSTLTFLGANRVLIGGFQFPASGAAARSSPLLATPAPTRTSPDDRVYGAWRPTFNLDLFYKLTESVSLGIENDLFFQSGRASEYFSFPFVTWEAGQHAFFQVGGGYYHFESRDQFTFLLHLNFVNPSVKQGDEASGGTDEKTPDDGRKGADRGDDDISGQGPIRQWWNRRLGNR